MLGKALTFKGVIRKQGKLLLAKFTGSLFEGKRVKYARDTLVAVAPL